MKIAVIGGHLSPALSVLDELPQDWEVVFYGRKHSFEGDTGESLEYQTITRRGIRFIPITTGRFQRKLTKHTIPSLYKFPKGYLKALLSLRNEKPDVVISFGGYVSLPICFAARTLGIPIVIHEQTFGAGLANKIISQFATKVCISWESSSQFFPKEKTVLTGNPLKKYTTDEAPLDIDESLPLLYVTGGSAGSHALNVLVQNLLPEVLHTFSMYHQTGDAKEFNDFTTLSTLRDTLSPELKRRYTVTRFVEPAEVGSLMKKAHIVLSRSGVNTVTELLYFSKPSVLVPLPYGQKNEQLTNAKFLEKQGMAVICDEETTTSTDLLHILATIMNNYDIYKKAATESHQLVHTQAAQSIIEVLKNVASTKTTQKRQTDTY